MSDAPKPKMIPPWTKMACANCGAEELATRADDESIGKALHERLLGMEARAENAEEAAFKLIDQVMGLQRDEASLRKRWAELGTQYAAERRRRQIVENDHKHIAEAHACQQMAIDLLTRDLDRWEQRALEADRELARMRAVAAMGDEDTPTVFTMSGETGQDQTDECECGGKMWCLTCQQSAWPSRADDCLAPTPEAS